MEASRQPGSLCLPLAPAEAGALGTLCVVPVRGPTMGLSLADSSGVGLGLRVLHCLACVDQVTGASGFPYRPSFDGGLGRCTGAVSCGCRQCLFWVGGRHARVPCVCACACFPGRVGQAGLPGAFWCTSPFSVAVLVALFVCSAPSGLELPWLWCFLPVSCAPPCLRRSVYSGPGCLRPWRLVVLRPPLLFVSPPPRACIFFPVFFFWVFFSFVLFVFRAALAVRYRGGVSWAVGRVGVCCCGPCGFLSSGLCWLRPSLAAGLLSCVVLCRACVVSCCGLCCVLCCARCCVGWWRGVVFLRRVVLVPLVLLLLCWCFFFPCRSLVLRAVYVFVLCFRSAGLVCLRCCSLCVALLPLRRWLVFCVVFCCVCVCAVGPGCLVLFSGGSWWLLVSCFIGVLWWVPGCRSAPCCCALCRLALCCCALCCFVLLCLVLSCGVLCPWALSVILGSCAFRRCVLSCLVELCVFCCGVSLRGVVPRCALCCVRPGVSCCAFPVLSSLCGVGVRPCSPLVPCSPVLCPVVLCFRVVLWCPVLLLCLICFLPLFGFS